MIEFARGLDLPDDAVTQTIALIGRKGSGKTYSAGKLVEGMVGIGAQVIVVDPVGVYWGLRLAANGTGPGLDIPILGGQHGDLPLTDEGGAIIANFAVDNHQSMVLDISMFRKAGRVRFVTAFAEQIFHRKKAARSPVHIVLEEAHKFIPQRLQKGEEAMVGAWEDIIRLGRNYGIGVTIISQRPQSVNKEVLNQTEMLVCHQVTGAHERKAIREWIVDQDLDVGEMVNDLPSLQSGHAYLWSPAWLAILKKIHVRKKWTYDASSTPEVGGQYDAEARPLTKIEITHLTDEMQQAVKVADGKDPAKLRKRIKALELDQSQSKQALADALEANALLVVPEIDEKAMAEQMDTAVAAAVEIAVKNRDAQWTGSFDEMAEGIKSITDACLPPEMRPKPKLIRITVKAQDAASFRRSQKQIKQVAATIPPLNGQARGFSGPQQKILDAIAWWEAMGVKAPSMGQLAFRSGYTPKGGTFGTYLSQLSSEGWIIRSSGKTSLTAKAINSSAPNAPDVSGGLSGLHRDVLQAIRNGKGTGNPHANLLEIIIEHEEISAVDLAEKVGYSPKGGTYGTYLSKLSSLGLIDRSGGMIRATSILFPVGV